LKNNAQWKGNLTANLGTAKLTMDSSQFDGNLVVASEKETAETWEEFLESIDNQLDSDLMPNTPEGVERYYQLLQDALGLKEAADLRTFEGKLVDSEIKNSTWNGNLEVSAGSADQKLTSASTWTGDVKLTGGETTLALDSSTWTGDFTDKSAKSFTLKNSAWKLNKDNAIDSVVADSTSAIFLEGAPKTLTVKNMDSSATFVLDLQYAGDDVANYRGANNSDYILVTDSAKGSSRIVATPESNLSGLTAGHKLCFATAPVGDATFNVTSSVSQYVTNSTKLYNLLTTYDVKSDTDATADYSGSKNWYLTLNQKEEQPNENAHVPGAAYRAALALWRDNDTLLKRLGELHENSLDNGAWVPPLHTLLVSLNTVTVKATAS
jgi:hypothetical protein